MMMTVENGNEKKYLNTGTGREFSQALKQAIRFSGCRQSDFARRLGVDPSALSYKLNGSKGFILTVPEIKRAIIILAEVEGINRRAEVLTLLRLAGLRQTAFTQVEWDNTPLSQLDE